MMPPRIFLQRENISDKHIENITALLIGLGVEHTLVDAG